MQKTSYLDAVNTCLRVLGEQPVSTTNGSLPPAAAAAVANLTEVSREVQQRGWHFNSEYAVALARNQDGKIPVPLNIARVDVGDVDVTERGGYLFNKEENSFYFDNDVEADVIRLLDWEDLPEAARNYIMIRAARKSQDRYNQGTGRYVYTEADENQAHLDLKDADADNADYTIWENYSAAQIINRPRPWTSY